MRALSVKDLNINLKPRERLVKHGSTYLSDQELLAILLGSGGKANSVLHVATNLLSAFGGLSEVINASYNQLCEVKNIGPARASLLISVREISLRTQVRQKRVGDKVTTPKDIFALVRKDIFNKRKEHLFVVCLNSRGELLKCEIVSVGTVNETLVHPREVFTVAIQNNANSIIIAHNHPSLNVSPSEEDIIVTRRVQKAGNIIGIRLLDHVIVTNNDFASLKSLGYMK